MTCLSSHRARSSQPCLQDIDQLRTSHQNNYHPNSLYAGTTLMCINHVPALRLLALLNTASQRNNFCQLQENNKFAARPSVIDVMHRREDEDTPHFARVSVVALDVVP
jgi:hypothetical protein